MALGQNAYADFSENATSHVKRKRRMNFSYALSYLSEPLLHDKVMARVQTKKLSYLTCLPFVTTISIPRTSMYDASAF